MRNIKNIRLKEFDYSSDGYYFVTIVSNFREKIFAEKQTIVIEELKDVADKNDGVGLDFYVVMSNHVHIIFILKQSKLLLGEIVRRFKAKVSKTFGKNVWQPNYYEHVIRNDKALKNIREYILHNPNEIITEFERFY